MLKDLLKDHRTFHSEFQQDYFITIKSGGTLYGQYKQSLRELYKRWRGLREGYCDREKLMIEIKEQEYLSSKILINKFEKQKAAVEFKRKTMQMEEAERTLKDTEREFKRFYQQAATLKEQLGDIDDDRFNVLEREMFEFKIKERVFSDIVCQGKMSDVTHELLYSMPHETRKELLENMQGEQMGDYMSSYADEDRDYFKNIKEIDLDVKCLLEG